MGDTDDSDADDPPVCRVQGKQREEWTEITTQDLPACLQDRSADALELWTKDHIAPPLRTTRVVTKQTNRLGWYTNTKCNLHEQCKYTECARFVRVDRQWKLLRERNKH